MTKHAFLEGMGLGVLAGAAIGMAVDRQEHAEPRRAPDGPACRPPRWTT